MFLIANYHYLDEHRVAPNFYGIYDTHEQFIAIQLLDIINSYRFAHHGHTLEVRDEDGEVIHEFQCNRLRATIVRDVDKKDLLIKIYTENDVEDFLKNYLLHFRLRFQGNEIVVFIRAFPTSSIEYLDFDHFDID